MFYWQFHNALVAATGGFLAGYCLGWTSNTQKEIMAGGLGADTTETEFSWVGGLLALGAAIFCVPVGLLTNWWGRKIVFILLSAIFVVGWLIMIALGYVWALFVGRILHGAAIGGYCVVAPLYIGEISEKQIRGRFGAAFQLMITGGILITYVIGSYLSVKLSCYGGAGLGVLYLLLTVLMPESPVYLVKKGNDLQAHRILIKLRSKDYNIDEDMAEIRRAVATPEEKASIGAAFKRRATIRALIMGLGLMFFQQMSGINAVIFYMDNIFSMAESKLTSQTATIIIGVVQVFATVLAVLLVDLVGRKLLLCISGGLMALSTAALAFYFFLLDSGSDPSAWNWLPLTSLCVFIVMFSLGFGPVPWLMMGELFASDVKAVAASLAATLNWLLAFVVSKTYVDFKNAIGTGPTFIIYTTSSLLSVVFTLLVLIETKGKSLNEIQEVLEQ